MVMFKTYLTYCAVWQVSVPFSVNVSWVAPKAFTPRTVFPPSTKKSAPKAQSFRPYTHVLLKVKCGYEYMEKFTPFLYIDGIRCHTAQGASQDTFLRSTRLVCKEIVHFPSIRNSSLPFPVQSCSPS